MLEVALQPTKQFSLKCEHQCGQIIFDQEEMATKDYIQLLFPMRMPLQQSIGTCHIRMGHKKTHLFSSFPVMLEIWNAFLLEAPYIPDIEMI